MEKRGTVITKDILTSVLWVKLLLLLLSFFYSLIIIVSNWCYTRVALHMQSTIHKTHQKKNETKAGCLKRTMCIWIRISNNYIQTVSMFNHVFSQPIECLRKNFGFHSLHFGWSIKKEPCFDHRFKTKPNQKMTFKKWKQHSTETVTNVRDFITMFKEKILLEFCDNVESY